MITEKDVDKIAGLAKLNYSAEEKQRFISEMSQILKFVEKLNELNLKDVEATSHAVSVNNVFREDQAFVSQVRDKVLEQAPSHEDNLFQVPRII